MSKLNLPPHWIEKRTPATPPQADPWKPAPRDAADHRAFRALRDGTATPEQQRRAVGWLIFATGARRQPFRSGPDGARATDFALGMAHIGLQVYEMLEMPVINSADDEQGER